MDPDKSFQGLKAWQLAMDLVVQIYELTAQMPADERFGLIGQMRRAAISVPSNIAEGHGRTTPGEFIQFIGHARGSLRELQTQLILAVRLKMLTDNKAGLELCDEIGRLLFGLEAYLRKNQNKKGPKPKNDERTN